MWIIILIFSFVAVRFNGYGRRPRPRGPGLESRHCVYDNDNCHEFPQISTSDFEQIVNSGGQTLNEVEKSYETRRNFRKHVCEYCSWSFHMVHFWSTLFSLPAAVVWLSPQVGSEMRQFKIDGSRLFLICFNVRPSVFTIYLRSGVSY